jgi:hypothetical protein
MAWKTLMTLSVSVTLATISMAPTAVLAQFPGPPPMGPGGPPPIGAGGPPAFGGPPAIGPGRAPHIGLGSPAPRLGAGAVPRGDLRPLGGVRAGGRGGPAVASSVRSASVNYNRSGGYGHRYGGGSRYGYRAAHAVGAYAAGAYSGYAYGHGYNSDSDCYRVYKRHRYILVCE